jgi:dTDP-4-dehydrorhamnose 3,5-epimerase
MQRIDLPFTGPCLLEPRVFEDARGCFFETWNERTLEGLGIAAHFVQENHSRSARGVLRGLHYQSPHAQGKLLHVLAGTIFDVLVDLRRASPTCGRAHCLRLGTEGNEGVPAPRVKPAPRMLWVPPGFAHGFLVLSEVAEVSYAVTDYYAPQAEHTLLWNDPALAIDWPLAETGLAAPLLSPKDAAGRPLAATPLFD